MTITGTRTDRSIDLGRLIVTVARHITPLRRKYKQFVLQTEYWQFLLRTWTVRKSFASEPLRAIKRCRRNWLNPFRPSESKRVLTARLHTNHTRRFRTQERIRKEFAKHNFWSCIHVGGRSGRFQKDSHSLREVLLEKPVRPLYVLRCARRAWCEMTWVVSQLLYAEGIRMMSQLVYSSFCSGENSHSVSHLALFTRCLEKRFINSVYVSSNLETLCSLQRESNI